MKPGLQSGMIRLSIITINFNNRDGLALTLGSIAAQSYRDFECIVVDGGSGDGSLEVIHQHQCLLSRCVSEADSGRYHAMNKGLELARGEFCLFLNSGDFLEGPQILSRVFGETYSEDILYGDLLFQSKDGRRALGSLPDSLSLPYLYFQKVWHPATFIRTDLLRRLGGYQERYQIAADYDFFFHAIAIEKVKCRRLPFPISVYDTHGISSQPASAVQVQAERAAIHHAYLSPADIQFLNGMRPSTVQKLRHEGG